MKNKMRSAADYVKGKWAMYSAILILAAPITLQNLASSSLGMVNTLMLGKAGDSVIAAVGLVNQYFFNFTLIMAGISSGCGVFISQFFGQENYKNIRKTLTLSVICNLIIAVPFSIISFFIPDSVMQIFTKEPELINIGSTYMRIILFSVLPLCISWVLAAALRSLHETKLPMIAGISALVCNTLLNFVLIFGAFGFPALGYMGAAYSTLISRVIECVILVIAFRKYISRYFSINMKFFMIKIDGAFAKLFLSTTLHMTLNDWLYGLATTVYMIAYAHAGVEALTALQVAGTIQNMTFVLIGGYSAAVSITIGKQVGANKLEEAYRDGFRYLKMAFALGIFCGGIVAAISPLAAGLFDLSEKSYSLVLKILAVYAIFMCIRFFNYISLAGVFRGSCDTRWVMFLELTTVWVIAVPLAFLGAYVFKLEIHYMLLLVMIEEVVKAAFIIPRMKSRKWLKPIQL